MPFHWANAEIDVTAARETLRYMQNMIYYKPPVGIVAILCMLRLIYTGRIFRLYDDNDNV